MLYTCDLCGKQFDPKDSHTNMSKDMIDIQNCDQYGNMPGQIHEVRCPYCQAIYDVDASCYYFHTLADVLYFICIKERKIDVLGDHQPLLYYLKHHTKGIDDIISLIDNNIDICDLFYTYAKACFSNVSLDNRHMKCQDCITNALDLFLEKQVENALAYTIIQAYCYALFGLDIPTCTRMISDIQTKNTSFFGTLAQLSALSTAKRRALITVELYGSIESLTQNSFIDLFALEFLILPKSIVSIESHAFCHCTALSSVEFDCKNTNIGDEIFKDCDFISSVKVHINSTIHIYMKARYPSVQLSFYQSDIDAQKEREASQAQTESETPQEHSKVKQTVYTLEEYRNIKPEEIRPDFLVVIPEIEGESVIETLKYFGCRDNIRSLSVREGVTEIAESAFANFSNMCNIELPSTLVSIGAGAFAGCTALRKITIPNSVSFIGFQAFYGCYSLEEVYFEAGDNCSIDFYNETNLQLFENCPKLRKIYAHKGSTICMYLQNTYPNLTKEFIQ